MLRPQGLLLLLLAGPMLAAPADAGPRVALVIGNGNYEGTAALANPAADATAIAEKLETLDFTVILATDVDRRDAIAAIDRFSREINGAEIALLFFAGHGIQIGGQNFLLPTDVSVESERALRYSAVDIQEVVAEMERRAQVAIAILDACRDNPYIGLIGEASRSTVVERGLGPMRLSGRGALIAYAAAAGDVAADGSGGHSPFTTALLAEVDALNVEVGLMFRRVARRVIDETHGDQRPELLVRLVDEVYLNTTADFAGTSAPPPPPPVPPPADSEPVVVADASRQVEAASDDGRFFGGRPIHPPPWAADVDLPEPSGWRSLAAVAIDEEANDSYGGAQRLPLAATVTASIFPRGEADWFLIEVPAAGELRLDVDPAPAEIDLFARIWDANHQVVPRADWQGAARAGGALAARFALPGRGPYWIELRDGNNDAESQTFALGVDFIAADDPFEPNDSLGAAAAVPASAEFQATIYPIGDADWYKLWVPEPGLFSALATEVPPTIDIAMRVWNLDGTVIRDWAVPARAGGDTILEAELAEPGVYLLQVADSNNDAAAVEPFRLSVALSAVPDAGEPNNTFGTATIVPPTGDHALAIFPRGDADWLAVDIDHPGELWLSATRSPENLDIYMRVWTADKQLLRDWFGPARVGGDVEDFVDLPSPGRYFIEIVDGNNDQASRDLFDLSLVFTTQPDQHEPNNSASTATPLTPGGVVLFNILPRGDTDWYRVETVSGGELAIVLDESPENLDLHFRVWDADRQIVGDWVAPYRMGGVAEGFADLPRADTYFIEVVDGNNDARSPEPATLGTVFTPVADTQEPNNGFGTAAPFAIGESIHANILPRGDTDWYLLEAPAAGTFVVTVDEVDEELDIVVRLWDREANAGTWIAPPRKGGVTEAALPVPAAGTYRLELADSNHDARSRNPYRLTIGFE
ncbi:MAG: caspase family protein [Dongiaceae bacterium]